MANDHANFDHRRRLEQLAGEFLKAQEAVIRRLSALSDDEAVRVPADGGWNAAEIGWHVATVNSALRATIAGETGNLSEAPSDFIETWEGKHRPPKIQAQEPYLPPPGVTRQEAIDLVRSASEATSAAILSLSPEQAQKVTQMRFGVLSVYQVAEFARMHTERHLGQLDRALSSR